MDLQLNHKAINWQNKAIRETKTKSESKSTSLYNWKVTTNKNKSYIHLSTDRKIEPISTTNNIQSH